jgi:hypothetical protein
MGGASTGVLFSIAIDAADTNVIYVSSPFCGVWKTEDGGGSWLVVGDSLPADLAVAAVACDPSTPNRVYALLQANQLYRSDDRAASWQRVGLGASGTTPAVTDLIVHPTEPLILHFRANGVCWMSNTGGVYWQPTKLGNASHLVLDQTNPEVVYVGIPTDGIYRSTDGGFSGDAGFTNLTTPGTTINSLAFVNVNDVKVALTSADPSTIYARLQRHLEADVYRSTDGGASWELRSTPPVYSALVGADPASALVPPPPRAGAEAEPPVPPPTGGGSASLPPAPLGRSINEALLSNSPASLASHPAPHTAANNAANGA